MPVLRRQYARASAASTPPGWPRTSPAPTCGPKTPLTTWPPANASVRKCAGEAGRHERPRLLLVARLVEFSRRRASASRARVRRTVLVGSAPVSCAPCCVGVVCMRALGAAPASPRSPCWAAAALTGASHRRRLGLPGLRASHASARQVQRHQVLRLEVQADVLRREVARVLVGEVEEGAGRARQLAALDPLAFLSNSGSPASSTLLVADHRPVLRHPPLLLAAVKASSSSASSSASWSWPSWPRGLVVAVVVAERAVVVVGGALGGRGRLSYTEFSGCAGVSRGSFTL